MEAERQAIISKYQTTTISQKNLAAKYRIRISTIQNICLFSFRETREDDTNPKLIPSASLTHKLLAFELYCKYRFQDHLKIA